MEKKSKINIVEVVLMGILVVSADAAEALAAMAASTAIGAILTPIAWLYGAGIMAIVLFWLIIKGVGIKWFLGGSGLDLIPFINAVPFRSAAFIMTVVMDRMPEKAKAVVGAVTGKPGAALKGAAKPTK